MKYSRAFARQSLTLCAESYSIAHGVAPALPPEFSAPVVFRMPAAIRPWMLAHDTLDVWGFVSQFDGKIYVVFRGTQTKLEWFADLTAVPMVTFETGHVHQGFYLIYRAVRQAVLDVLPLGYRNSDLIIMGHSLGAALATLFFLDMEHAGTLITFASPRVVDPALAAVLWKANAFRVQNLPDAIPKLPTDPPWRHGGAEVLVRGPGSDFDLDTAHSINSYDIGLLNTPE